MKRFWVLFTLQMRTLFLFVILLAFLYLPGQNIEINLLPFRINTVSLVIAWYYAIIFLLGSLYVYLRFVWVRSLFLNYRKLSLINVLVSDGIIALCGMLFLFMSGYELLTVVFLLYSFVLGVIDWCCYREKGPIRFMYIVLML